MRETEKNMTDAIMLSDLKEQSVLSMAETVHIMLLVCDSVQKLHDDDRLYLKCMPENISVYPDQEGIVKSIELRGRDEAMKISDVHKHGYKYDPRMDGWAPFEQMHEEKRLIDVQADIYSAGMLFLWLATGKKPVSEHEPDDDDRTGGISWKNTVDYFSGCGEEIVQLVRKILTNSLCTAANSRYIHIGLLKKDFGTLEKKLNALENRQRHAAAGMPDNHPGIIQLDNGAVYEGTVKDDKRDGEGKQVYANGDVYEGGWKSDRREGFGVLKRVNGEMYEGTFSKGLREGQGKQTYANGDVYEGKWKHGKRHGYGELKNGSNLVYKGRWMYDRQDRDGGI